MPRKSAMRTNRLDWDREFCKRGCEEWIPWYRGLKGKTVFGCRIGAIPRRANTHWYCQHQKLTGVKQ